MIQFQLDQAINILKRTPKVLSCLLDDLPEEWIHNNEGDDSWSPFDILGHFIHGEKTDWIPRAQLILSDKEDKAFAPFDRFAQFETSKGKSLIELLNEFSVLRARNIELLEAMQLTAVDLVREGIHPEFGKVTLEQLLATWVTHDLGHIAQITRVMAKQYKDEVGPWRAYIPILRK